ncbi:4-hydroxythreonine-4-phosphate dehydrogenase PdxA [Rhizobium sp. L1K21]|uniref:4-hydroxythreonine-4-phosphate dehydrogenase PdxA n=1 Tax=Rhizobium sp. L1K21 TaxID=2954933 RepID=UPI0020927219|nr:4-hydroxythreonine-4-phosphate dehydrogenase PdxA [Rhizobium sp. L1K21]MCO6186519.1 4-hydroxythreonine-4-phosphate dehydrogenase PdxA [Rhizobium sp. L1K21]
MATEHIPLPLAVSQGDPAGVGPDILIGAWQARNVHHLKPFIALANPTVLRERAKLLGVDLALKECSYEDAASVFDTALPVLPLALKEPVIAGRPQSGSAQTTIDAIRLSVEAVQTNKAAAVVTCPIAKSVLYEAGFQFPGHTEYLAALCADANGNAPLPVMMIAGPELKTVPVTIHIPLSAVPGALNSALIEKTCRIIDRDLKARFGISKPRLAISGLNPHAGESGALGGEDDAIIRPAIETLVGEGIDAFGPLPGDTMFHKAARDGYDVAVCMYHDQALIPAKALGFDDAVNVTLGLPIIRTSPDHGTAFSIAGTGKARPDSMIAALKMAAEMAHHSGTVPV